MSKYWCCGTVCPESSGTSFLTRHDNHACPLWWKGYAADCWLLTADCLLPLAATWCFQLTASVNSFFRFLFFTKECVVLWSFLSATILSCGWIIYLTYYNSRNIGLILTLIINRLYKDGYIHIGERVRTSVELWWMGEGVGWTLPKLSVRGFYSIHWIFHDEPLPLVIIYTEREQKTTAAACANDTEAHLENMTHSKQLISFSSRTKKALFGRCICTLT